MGHLIVVLVLRLRRVHAAARARAQPVSVRVGRGHHLLGHESLRPVPRPFWWFKAYWAGWALLFAVLSNMFWVRGQEMGAAWRARLARRRARAAAARGGRPGAAASIVGVGGFIFYNTNILNEYRTTSDDGECASAEYERQYKQYEHLPQPRIVGVRVDVDLVSEGARRMRCEASTGWSTAPPAPIDTIHVRIPRRSRDPTVGIRRAGPADARRRRGSATTSTRSTAASAGRGRCGSRSSWPTSRAGSRTTSPTPQVVENGTFVNSAVMPAFGYEPARRAVRGHHAAQVRPCAEGAHAVARRRGGATEQLHFRWMRTGWISRPR